MLRRALVLALLGAVAVVPASAASAGGGKAAGAAGARHYGPAGPAVAKSAPGHGAVKTAHVKSFAALGRLAAGKQLPRVVPAPSLRTTSGQAAKQSANRLGGATGKASVSLPASTGASPAEPHPSYPGIGEGASGFIPPDVNIAAGPFHLIEVVNGRITVFNKNGSTASTASAATFFDPLGTPADDFIFDPHVRFDEYIGRFVVTSATRNDAANRSNILVAISSTNDPTQGWSFFAFNARLNGGTDTNNWCDYDQVGYDSQTLYFTCNMFSTGSSPSFQYSKIRIMTTAQFTGGASCCFWWDKWDLREGFANTGHVFSIDPLSSHDAINSDGGFLVAAEGGGGSGSNIHVYRVPNPQNCCVSGNQTDPGLTQQDRGVGSYSTPPSAEQPGSVQNIDTGDTRLLFAGSVWPDMYFGQTIANGSDATVAYTEFDFRSFPTLSTVNDFDITPGGMNRYYPAVDANEDVGPSFVNAGDKTMVFSFSNSSTDAGTNFFTFDRGPLANLAQFALHGGASTYLQLDDNNLNRWGDYLGAARDPNGVGVWIGGEFVASQDTWGTEIGLSRQTIDTFAPFTSASLTPTPNGNGWNNTNVTVNLSASDSGIAGVRRIIYFAQGANPIGVTQVNGSTASVPITADGITTVFYEALDNWGNLESLRSITVRKDTVAPAFSKAPNASFVTNSTLGQGPIPVRVSWLASDATSGICSYTLQESKNGGAFNNIALPSATSTSVTLNLLAGPTTHRYRAVATDCAGNPSAFSVGRLTVLKAFQESVAAIAYSTGWTLLADVNAFGGHLKSTTLAGRNATFTFSGATQVAWVARKGSSAGSASVQLDGVSQGNVSLNAASTLERRIVFQKQGMTTATHHLKVTDLGTAGHPAVNIDAFLTLS